MSNHTIQTMQEVIHEKSTNHHGTIKSHRNPLMNGTITGIKNQQKTQKSVTNRSF